MRYELMGAAELAKGLQAKSQADFEKVRNKNLLQMRVRAVSSRNVSKGGTPVGNYKGGGELRLSAGVDTGGGFMGYTKDYAPHVNYGHRLVIGGRTVGYVPGQNFLGANVNIQNPIYRQDLIDEMRAR